MMREPAARTIPENSVRSKSLRDRHGHRARGTRIGMTIVANPPRRIEFHEHVRKCRLIENPLTKRELARLFFAELRNENQRRGAAGTREIDRRAKHFTRDFDAALDRFIAAITQQALRDRREAPALRGRQPDEMRAEVRTIVVKVAIEE